MKDFLNLTLKQVMSAIHAECGSLFFFDAEHKVLVMDSFYNSADLHIKALKQRIGEGIAGKVADTKTPVLVKDINSDARFKCNGFTHYRTNSFISIPISSPQGRLIGLINLADKANGKPFTDDDLKIAVTMINYANLALDSLQSLAQLKKEKEALDKQKSLLEKYASVGKLAAGIVHEVNNPLDGIMRYTNMLINQAQENSIAREYLLEIKNGLERIAQVTKSLYEFSHRVNACPLQMQEYIDAHKLIDETLNVLGGRSFSNIKVRKEYDKSLPKVLDLGLSHIVINIIKNAIDAMPEGGTLTISTRANDTTVEISFIDTGAGIKDEDMGLIFEPFFTTKGAKQGSGLGLAICNEIIHKYEGKIQADSRPGEGTSFTISIPLKYTEINAQR